MFFTRDYGLFYKFCHLQNCKTFQNTQQKFQIDDANS